MVARSPIRDAPKGTRITVRHRQFTGNSAIDIAIHGVPLDWAIDGVKQVGPGRTWRRLSEPCAALADAVAAISGAYKWRGDDTLMQDYVDVGFYSTSTSTPRPANTSSPELADMEKTTQRPARR
ncbi:hypothetical protein J5Y04_31360 [Kitasatospora sp. RG8]|uniref:hypothetical protein n=1 Tax=Kitasatospora sp. RG8 TaxID=2820815 RepID=UPI001ADF4A54|nr:hypothetical protein [Kitasatospora sp. RG8]MBP0454006.1 hypothetical protein [Kitasatospora sp. RG8]